MGQPRLGKGFGPLVADPLQPLLLVVPRGCPPLDILHRLISGAKGDGRLRGDPLLGVVLRVKGSRVHREPGLRGNLLIQLALLDTAPSKY